MLALLTFLTAFDVLMCREVDSVGQEVGVSGVRAAASGVRIAEDAVRRQQQCEASNSVPG